MEAMIFGAGKPGREALRILRADNSLEIIGFLDDELADSGRSVGGLRVLGGSGDLSRFRRFGVEGICIAVPDGQERLRLAELSEKAGYYLLTARSGKCRISPDAYLGKGCLFMDHCRVESGALIRHCSLIGTGVEIKSASVIPAGSNVLADDDTERSSETEKGADNSVYQSNYTRGGASSK